MARPRPFATALLVLFALGIFTERVHALPPRGAPRIPVSAFKRCQSLHPSACKPLAKLAALDAEPRLQAGLVMLAHRDPWIRRAGARLLHRVADPKAAAKLVTLLGETDVALRTDVIDALGTCGRAEDAPAVRALLPTETERPARVAVVRTLGRLRDTDSAPAILLLVSDPDGHVSEAAIVALGMMRHKGAVAPLVALHGKADTPTHLLVASARALVKIDDAAAVPGLMTTAHHADIEVRRASIHALGAMNAKPAIPLLIELLSDGEVLAEVTRALGAIDDPQTIDPLWAMMRADDLPEELRRSVLQAFGRRKVTTAVPELLAMMRDKGSSLRVDVIRALGEIKDERAIARLIEALEDADPAVVGAANSALSTITGQTYDPDPAIWKRWLTERGAPPGR